MYHQATEESAVAFKKLHETVNAILQMEDDELDVISNHIFLATLVDNSSMLSLCDEPLQAAINRIRARLDIKYVLKDDNDTKRETQSSITEWFSIEDKPSDGENSIHENLCYESSSNDTSESNGIVTNGSNDNIIRNTGINPIEPNKDIAEEAHLTDPEETLSMKTLNHYDSEQKDFDANQLQQQQKQHQDVHHTMSFVTYEVLNFDYINSNEIPVNHPRNFVFEAIQSFEMNEVEGDVQTHDISTTVQMDEADIQAVVNVETTPMNVNDVKIQAETAETPNAPNTPNTWRPKRTIKPNPRFEFLLKKKRCMSVDSRSTQNDDESKDAKFAKAMEKRQSAVGKTISGEPKTVRNDKEDEATKKKVKAMQKRQSAIRKTVSGERPALKEAERNEVFLRNTNQQIFAKNHMYRTLCVFCNQNQRNLVCHYVNEHPDDEVPIARPSPTMADSLRQQSLTFEKVDRKIFGICIFCEERKGMIKGHWEQHFLIHTGEKMYSCKTCHASTKVKREHGSECPGEVVRIYHENASDASVNCFMCNDCNYLQISRERILKHLEVEHGFLGPSENNHYKKLQLISTTNLF